MEKRIQGSYLIAFAVFPIVGIYALVIGSSAVFWILLLLIPYIAPTLVAILYTKKRRWKAIAFWNVFFGLTGIGWLICFLWACKPDREDMIRQSPRLQAIHAQLRASRDAGIRLALQKASRSGFPEDQERLNAMVAEYKSEYGTLPHAIRESLEAQRGADANKGGTDT